MAAVQPDFDFDQTITGRERRIRDLPTFYYHGHFVELLDFVGRHYAHVLDAEHRAFLADFRVLSHEAQCLYVRLFNRKGVVFSRRRLRYPELGDLAPVLTELETHGFVGVPESRHFDQLLRFMTRAAILDVLMRRFAGLARSMKKAELVAFARRHCDAGEFVAEAGRGDTLVQRRANSVRFLAFLYFGRLQDGLQRFTMRDLGLVRTHDFCESFEPRFADRDEAKQHFYFACRLREERRADDDALKDLARASSEWPEPMWPGAAADRDELAYRIGRRLQRSGDRKLALEVYGCGESVRCNERVVRMLLADKRRDEARTFLERCIDEPRNEEEWLFANDLYARTFDRKRTSALTDLLRSGDVVDLDESLSGSPERAVAAHFESAGARAWRTENALWRTLFGLLFWPELYGEGNAALHSPFDFLPACLEDNSFADAQADAVERRLALLEDRTALMRHLLRISTRHYGTPNGVFRWRRSVLDAIFSFIDAAPAAATRSMLMHFVQRFSEVRYGYPDLMLIDGEGVRFVEVKTDGDQLRRNQLARIEQLRGAGFRADIVRVRWTLDPQTTYVVVDVETTGGRGERHRITEIGAIKLENGEIVDRFSTLINPQRTIPAGISRLTGITAEMVADAPYFADVADAFADFMGDAIFVAHNVEFDYGFVSREYARLGRRFRHPKLCTCASMRRLFPGHRSYSLSALCSRYDIPLKNHHRALCDAEAAAGLLLLINERRAEKLAADAA